MNEDSPSQHKDQTKETNKSPTLRQLIASILGAAFGVQNSATRERDFQQTSPKAYIIGGIIFGVVFVLSLVVLVNFILGQVAS